MALRIEFVETSRRWRRTPSVRKLAREAIAAAAQASGAALLEGAELTVHLLDDERMRALNAQWRGKDEPTNVLSFPGADPGRVSQARLLGDILLGHETIVREADAEDKRFADHVRHLVAHGFLHLIGYDHVDPGEAETMEALETRALARLGIADPYAASERETTPAP